jgi:hypothetical protein
MCQARFTVFEGLESHTNCRNAHGFTDLSRRFNDGAARREVARGAEPTDC